MKRILPSLALGCLLVACTVAPPATPPVATTQPVEAPVAPAAIVAQPTAAPSAASSSPTPTAAPSPSPSPVRRSKRRSSAPQDTVSFQDADLGAAVLNYQFTPQGEVEGVRRGQATMAVRLQDGTRANVAFDDYDLPVEGDEDDYVVVTEGANVRTYKADQEFMSYTIAAPDASDNYRVRQLGDLPPGYGEEREEESEYVDPAWEAATWLTMTAYPSGGGIAYDIASSAASSTYTGYGPITAAEICLNYKVMREASLAGLIALYSVVKERPETSTGMGPAAAFALLNHQPVAGARAGRYYGGGWFRVLSGDGETLNPAASVLKEIIRLRQAPPDIGEEEGDEGRLEE